MVIPGHNLGNSQVSVNRTIGPTLVTLLLIQEEYLSVNGERMCIKYGKPASARHAQEQCG